MDTGLNISRRCQWEECILNISCCLRYPVPGLRFVFSRTNMMSCGTRKIKKRFLIARSMPSFKAKVGLRNDPGFAKKVQVIKHMIYDR